MNTSELTSGIPDDNNRRDALQSSKPAHLGEKNLVSWPSLPAYPPNVVCGWRSGPVDEAGGQQHPSIDFSAGKNTVVKC